MRRISANLIYTLEQPEPIKNGIIEITDTGIITSVMSNDQNTEFSSTEFFNGVIIPAIISASINNVTSPRFTGIFNNQIWIASDFTRLEELTQKENERKNYSLWQNFVFLSLFLTETNFTRKLKWITRNKAEILGLFPQTGTIATGEKARLQLIYPFDFKQRNVLINSRLKII